MDLERKDEFKNFAIDCAKGAGRILMKYYGEIQESDQEWTTLQHFKTIADDESDDYIRDKIKRNYPEHSIYSEEGDDLEKDSEYSWIVDPLDGTNPFRFRMNDHFAVCIALVKDKEPIMGVLYAPKMQELYYAVQGKGSYCNGKRLKPSNEDIIKRVMIGFDSGKETDKFDRSCIAPYIQKLLSRQGVSCPYCSGCASIPMAFVASGRLHAYGALSLEPWDMTASVIINKESGNKVTTIDGTLKENNNWHDRIQESLGQSYIVETAADGLNKCILKGIHGVIYLYSDLTLSNKRDLLPKGGTFNVQNLVR